MDGSPESSLRIDFIPADAAGDAALSRLLDSTFPVPAGGHFFDDFPIWNAAISGELIRAGRLVRMGVYDGDALVGCTGVRLAELKLGGRQLKIALIGAVATLTRYQGHGFASRLVSIAMSWAQERGATLAMLWGSEHALYRRLGFELCGQQLRAKLAGLELRSTAPVNRGWTPAIFEKLGKRIGGLVLNAEDRPWIEAHRGTRWFWTGEVAAPTAYAAYGRGIDLQGMVHEWGGDRNALFSILSEIRGIDAHAELLGPAWAFERYSIPAALATSEFLGMACVLNLPAILECFPDRRPAVSEVDAQAVRLLFGPPSEGAPFPLPLWLWGLDAV